MVAGAQRPRIEHFPMGDTSLGREAVELAASAGLVLDDWEAYVLENALGRQGDSWTAFEVGLVVPRQNGKGSILEARELAGLFLIGERMIIHSAHQFDTSLEAFRRLLFLIEETPDLDRQVKRVSRSHGEEGIELMTGQRLRFRTRTKGGGRGFSADCLILDEAMFLPVFAHGALLPTLSARPNPQVWYTGSAVDKLIHEDGFVLSRVRNRGLASEPGLAYFEWSVDEDQPDDVAPAKLRDPLSWAMANPAMGIRITEDHITLEHASMDDRTFAVERLSVGDWPQVDRHASVIDVEKWDALADLSSKIVGPVCFAFDVSPDRSFATISVTGRREDELVHLEVVDRRRSTGWLVPRLLELNAAHQVTAFVCDARGPAASLLDDLAKAGLTIVTTSAQDHADACGMIFDAIEDGLVRHLATNELASAIRGAAKRPLGDAWAWSRKNSAVDISPLVSVTLAYWGLLTNVTSEVFAFSW